MRFDLTDLRLFLAVVDAGSITHGAADAGLSLAAASERLRDMEATGEVVLLTRGRRGVVPTEAGEALAHHARAILHQMAQMRGELGHYAKGLRTMIRILANTAAVTEFLPRRLAPWMAAHPQADVELKERQSVEIAKAIAAGFAEIGILSSAAVATGLTLRPFALDRLVMVASRNHPLAAKAEVRFADLLDQHFIGLTGGALQRHIDMQAENLGAKLKVRVALRNFDGICRMAGEGVGIGIVPESAARRSKRSARIAIARLQDDWATRRLSVCVRSEAELTSPTRSLFEYLSAPAG
ncbi:LysR family transcriptional regulator [Telmatospirillum siberiense]|uniref:LysR family transcriptional regulator n=1 Tax=Telmatospirillum siberiense TaxID=382514 RepID=A0A2N3PU00_9PROT|nr:LysR family transcriptional regulator [Telmatospirillum siberiense]PKU23873.1 LysR family transcriptional regulator [Telmatospirillum siberiense]